MHGRGADGSRFSRGREWRFSRSPGIPMGGDERSVKLSAQPWLSLRKFEPCTCHHIEPQVRPAARCRGGPSCVKWDGRPASSARSGVLPVQRLVDQVRYSGSWSAVVEEWLDIAPHGRGTWGGSRPSGGGAGIAQVRLAPTLSHRHRRWRPHRPERAAQAAVRPARHAAHRAHQVSQPIRNHRSHTVVYPSNSYWRHL
jgi:hypothetical protein